MSKYKCIVAYDGYDYYGYQNQSHESKTIQNEIESILSTICKEKITIFASGRTDRKVHALGQVFHFETSLNIKNDALLKAMNSLLSSSIRILKVTRANKDFHARYSVKKKQYLYQIKNSSDLLPMEARYYALVKEKIDMDLLNEASKLFIGEHDFKNFTLNKEDEVHSFNKTIYQIKISKKKDKIFILFEGSGFLRAMIRMMVGAMIAVATKKKDLSYIENLLNLKSKDKCGYKAKPEGLYLKKVIY